MLVLVTFLMLPPDPIAQSLTFPRDARSCRQRDRAHDGGVTGLLIGLRNARDGGVIVHLAKDEPGYPDALAATSAC
jgi:hypothetical protein